MLDEQTVAAMNASLARSGSKFTYPELREAFEAVQHHENWKFGNIAVIPSDKIEVTTEAVTFFAGGGLKVLRILVSPSGSQCQIKFPGYYEKIGS